MTLVMSLVAAAVSAYIAAGAATKMRARPAGAADLLALVGIRYGERFGTPLYRVIGVVEFAMAGLALWPGSAQRLGLIAQAALLTAFVGVVGVARHTGVPCGCFGGGRTRPRGVHVGVALLACAAAWTLAVGPRPHPTALIGVVMGCIAGFVVTEIPRSRRVDNEGRESERLLTRRAAITKGATALAALGGGLAFGWKHALPAAATTSQRQLAPRHPTQAEIAAAQQSELGAAMLLDHGLDPSLIAWDQATWYDDRWPTRTIGMLIAPVRASAVSYVHVPSAIDGAREGAALLQEDLTGSVRQGGAIYELDKGRLVPDQSSLYTTSGPFESDFIDCLTGVGGAVLAMCCALCGFARSMWGPCCGCCAIGVAIGCLWISIT